MPISLSDKKIMELVNEYNGEPVAFKCIVYVCIEGGLKKVNPDLFGSAILIEGIMEEDLVEVTVSATKFAVLTFDNKIISLYVFDAFGNEIEGRIDFSIEQIHKVKMRKFIIWNTLKFYFLKEGKIKLTISDKTLGLKNQKENVDVFLGLLNDHFGM